MENKSSYSEWPPLAPRSEFNPREQSSERILEFSASKALGSFVDTNSAKWTDRMQSSSQAKLRDLDMVSTYLGMFRISNLANRLCRDPERPMLVISVHHQIQNAQEI
jgi:hypothetical protein